MSLLVPLRPLPFFCHHERSEGSALFSARESCPLHFGPHTPTSKSPRAQPYLLVSTIGICDDNCRLISRSTRRSIWYHNAVFLAEITFSKIGTYFIRRAR